MSVETERQYSYEEAPALPNMMLIDIVEGMKPEQRQAEKSRLLSEISDRETLVNLINAVQDAEGHNRDLYE